MGRDMAKKSRAQTPRRPRRRPEPARKIAAQLTAPEPAEIASADPPVAPFIVGVGASAGGLEAFSALLRGLPAQTGVAIVFVQHLAPRHESALVPLLRAQS